MRPVLMIAAFLAFGIPVCGQQNQQQDQQHPSVQPIPTNPNEWHGYEGPIPTVPLDPPSRGPIPNWKLDDGLGWHAYAFALGPCAILEPAGKKYQYFDGNLPGGIKPKKKFTDAELQGIKKNGGAYRILNRGSSTSERDDALDACYESTARRLP